MTMPAIIAVDGPAASGKSTIAERLANDIGYMFFDTGVMYRAITWAAINKFGRVDDETAVSDLARKVKIDIRPPSVGDQRKNDVILDGRDITWLIRTPEVETCVSLVSSYKIVREEMVAQQRQIGKRCNTVMVGRDIGTVVFPEAELKLFLEASVEERARRRFVEMKDRGSTITYEEILESMRKRDLVDSTRVISPLHSAADAIIIHTDGKNIDEVVKIIKSHLIILA
jgi:CMP/dCMP kinase